MPKNTTTSWRRSENLLKQFEASIRQASEQSSDELYELLPHRTFHWYLAIQVSKLEACIPSRRPRLSRARQKTARTNAENILTLLQAMFENEGLAPKPPLVRTTLYKIVPTKLAYERLAYYVVTELQAQLPSGIPVKPREEEDGELLSSSDRHKPRDRSELPDPTLPAWATVNRMPPKKVQIPCRVDPTLRAMIADEADKLGISQSRWLEEAIAEKLRRRGHEVKLEKARKVQAKKPTGPARRTQRAEYPVPEGSPDLHANRADFSTSTRMGPKLAAEIDKARGQQDRSSWLNQAISAFLDEKAELPEALGERELQTEPFGVRFDRDFFPVVEAAAKKSGYSKSEWYRRVARWYLDK